MSSYRGLWYPVVQEVPEQDMPRLYAAVDAFVLPTRGEGFGMPIMEAMSMVRPPSPKPLLATAGASL